MWAVPVAVALATVDWALEQAEVCPALSAMASTPGIAATVGEALGTHILGGTPTDRVPGLRREASGREPICEAHRRAADLATRGFDRLAHRSPIPIRKPPCVVRSGSGRLRSRCDQAPAAADAPRRRGVRGDRDVVGGGGDGPDIARLSGAIAMC